MVDYESYDERLGKLIMRAHNACCDGSLEHELARKMVKALVDLHQRYHRLAKTARGRRREIKVKATYIRHQDSWVRGINDWNSHLLDVLQAEVRRLAALEAAVQPFKRVADGLPDNWPGECVHSVRVRADNSFYSDYFCVRIAAGAPTIGDYRALADAAKEAK